MGNYIDVVLVAPLEDREERIICKCPAFSSLKPGDTVILAESFESAECVCEVLAKHTFDIKSDELRFVLQICDVDGLPKLKSRIVYKNFEYEGADDE